jgi:hypothetical protein
MIVCHCRNISDQDYATDELLLRRLCEPDRDCCSCIAAIMRKRKHLPMTDDYCINVTVETNTEE